MAFFIAALVLAAITLPVAWDDFGAWFGCVALSIAIASIFNLGAVLAGSTYTPGEAKPLEEISPGVYAVLHEDEYTFKTSEGFETSSAVKIKPGDTATVAVNEGHISKWLSVLPPDTNGYILTIPDGTLEY